MFSFTKTQLLIWGVVLLVILNAATIGAIVYHNYEEKRSERMDVLLPGPGGGNPLNGRFLKQELGFSQGQLSQFRELNQDFRPLAMDITLGIDSLKELMYDQMQAEHPDTNLVQQTADQIGKLHSNLKMETFRFYQQLRNICTKEQAGKLAAVFRPLFINEQTGPHQGPRFQGAGFRHQQFNK